MKILGIFIFLIFDLGLLHQLRLHAQQNWETVNASGVKLMNNKKFDSAIMFLEPGLRLAEKESGKQSKDYADAAGNLGVLYLELGRFEEAEALIFECVRLSKMLNGSKSSTYAINLTYKGIYYRRLGNYSKAKQCYEEAESIIKENFTEWHPRYGDLVSSMATLYYHIGNYRKARILMEQAVWIYELNVGIGKKSPKYARSLGYLGSICSDQNYLALATNLLDTALVVLKTAGTKEEINDAKVNLAYIQRRRLNLSEAESLYLDVLQGMRSTQENFATIHAGLAFTYEQKAEYKKAEIHYDQMLNCIHGQLDEYFRFLSEFERHQFYQTIRPDFDRFNNFCVTRPTSGRLGKMYDLQLDTKGLLLSSATKWKQKIKASGDKKLFTQFMQWEAKRAMLANWQRQRESEKRIDSLEEVCNAIEKGLTKRSEDFTYLTKKKELSWKDLKSKLMPGQVAIEIVRVPKWGIKSVFIDSSDLKFTKYPEFGVTDTIAYAALLIHSQSEFPELVVFPNGHELEGKGINYYNNMLQSHLQDTLSFDLFWKPIENKIKSIKAITAIKGKKNTIFVCPDGVYHKINLNTLYNPASRRFLLDDVQLKLLTNGREIAEVKRDEPVNNLAYLFGSPYFPKEANSDTVSETIRDDITLADLPASKEEVEKADELLRSNGWKTELNIGSNASEEALKDCYRPRLLHLATHGYFFGNEEKQKGSLSFESGLFLSKPTTDPDSKEDGLLTSNEVANLNLDNTDLVVLSACETGRGNIMNGEGIYGLQRAFKVSGARTILMSLWKIDDTVTKELMISFYKNWLDSGDKFLALEKAQSEMKQKYPSPYYWGPFVIIGE